MISKLFHHDRTTLWTLLFFNHFFFHIFSMSLLYADPFKCVPPKNEYKLVTLIIASVTHTQR